ncbi:glycosyl hydrolase [Termitidicoccus mucosus]|uniref:Beta-mannosidase-like galactose-binding domain-containing protein n=1 Tax=Termitidicoccus mucosus TaxID=1184151 RepID=A0A178INK4_9BACT|nr:hypothetical protein AW736_06310 [Opitutaceae bacterium TSB47]
MNTDGHGPDRLAFERVVSKRSGGTASPRRRAPKACLPLTLFVFLPVIAASFVFGCAGLVGAPIAAISPAEFRAPPAWARPHAMWQWVGYNITKEGITKDLESMKNVGVGGAIVFQITSAGTSRFAPVANVYSPGVEYYNDEWLALLRHAAAEAQRLGLELGLHNCIGWSVSGGPWIKPENAMQRVVWSETRVAGPRPYDRFLDQPATKMNHYKDIAVLLVPDGEPAPGDIINITGKMRPDGRLVCEIPRGKYTLYRFGHTPTGSKPNAAPENTDALEADKMSAAAMSLHMRSVLEPLQKHLGDYVGRSLKVIHFDSYEAGGQDWTPLMREEFQARKGYDIIPWLPVLAGRMIESKEAAEGFKRDLKAAVADMFLEYSFQLPKKMIHEAGMEMQSEPYATGPGNVARPFNTFDAVFMSDRPTTEFWFHRRADELDIWRVGSAIPFFGKTILSAEAFSGRGEHSRWSETPARLKFSGDLAFSLGINRMILHHWVHQPFPDHIKPGMSMGPWGTHFGRNQTWYEPGKAWLAYLARSQYLLQQGEKVSDFIAMDVYVPGGDVISEKSLLNHVNIKDGRLTGPTGRIYHLLAISGKDQVPLSLEALAKIEELVTRGAVVFGPKPSVAAPSLDFAADEKKFKELADRIWGKGPLPETGENSYKKGKVLWGGSVDEALRRLNVPASVEFQGSRDRDDSICWLHRQADGVDIFYFSNLGEESKHLNVALRAKNKTPETWDPETGAVRPVAIWRPTDTGANVSLSLKPNQALFVVFEKTITQDDFAVAVTTRLPADDFMVERKADGWIVKSSIPGVVELQTAAGRKLSAAIDAVPDGLVPGGPWNVEFKPPVGQPFSTKFDKLESWTRSDDKRIKYFSGTAIYTNTFRLPETAAADDLSVILNLGVVKELASVSVNGKFVATLWHTPFEVDVTGFIKPGENELRIEVANTWANRLIGDNDYPDDCEWSTGNQVEGRPLRRFPGWLLENKPRPSGQRQAFSTWDYFNKKSVLADAGLLDEPRLEFRVHAAFSRPE